MRSQRETFRALNGLRFFAAMAVVCFHYVPELSLFVTFPEFLKGLVWSGPIALPFFYILSGFVLAHSYVTRLPTKREERNAFWLARVARLYPIYLTAFVLFLPMAYVKYFYSAAYGGPQTFVIGGALSLVVLQAWTPYSQAWNGPSWSISVEAFFYFLFPFIAGNVLERNRRLVAAVVLVSWSLMLLITIAHLKGIIPAHIWTGWVENNPLFWTPMFLWGIALYRLFPWLRERHGNIANLISMAALGALLVVCGLANPWWREVLIGGGAAPFIALAVLAYSHPVSMSSRVMGTAVLYELGALSYVLYITQSPIWHVFYALTDRLRQTSSQTPAGWQFLLFMPILIGIAFALRKYIERPAQAYIMARHRAARGFATVPADPSIEAT